MNREKLHADIVVIGAGIAGLMATRELSQKGYDVVLVEKAKQLATGATTRNQGWLHAGTLQANQGHFDVDKRKRRVVEVKTGFDRFRRYLPTCIEDSNSSTYVVFSDQELSAQAEEDWLETEIPYTQIPLLEFFSSHVPEVNPDLIKTAFKVPDISINTRKLCGILAEEIQQNGGRIFTDTELLPIDQNNADITIAGRNSRINSGLFVVTAGAGIKSFFEKYTDQPFPMRYLQDFSLISPKLTQHGVIWRQPKSVNIMPHGETSITCFGSNISETEQAQYDIDPRRKEEVFDPLISLLPGAERYKERSILAACLKPFMTTDPEVTSGDIKIEEWVPGYIYCIPGKMTTAPVAAGKIVDFVDRYSFARRYHEERSPSENVPQVSTRPCDIFVAN